MNNNTIQLYNGNGKQLDEKENRELKKGHLVPVDVKAWFSPVSAVPVGKPGLKWISQPGLKAIFVLVSRDAN